METTWNQFSRFGSEERQRNNGKLATLGIPTHSAINVFYKQVVLEKDLPIETKQSISKMVKSGIR